jgi:AraC-like DNA-binding protein
MTAPCLQTEFFARMADPQAVRAIFEHLPGVFFFVKDAQGRHIAANSVTFQRFGIRSERELVGATDERFFPAEVAKAYREDDQKVILTGRPLINRLEVWYDEQHNLDWFLTTKLPVRDHAGKIIGVMGITRRDEDRMRHHDVREVTAAVHHARKNYDKNLSAADLARAAGVSERHLHRKLRATLDLTPHELMLRTRIQSAAEALAKTSAPIIEIALNHGFCDQSAFTQQFRKRTGMTPRQFRVRIQG